MIASIFVGIALIQTLLIKDLFGVDEVFFRAAQQKFLIQYSVNKSSVTSQILNFQKAKKTNTQKNLFSAQKFSNNSYDQQLLQNFQKKIKNVLSTLPKDQVKIVRSIEIQNEKNVSRGMANDQKIILNTKSIKTQDELTAVFVHEFGHVVDLGFLTTKTRTQTAFSNTKASVFENDPSLNFYKISWENSTQRKEESARNDFVSGYSMSNPFEDFAESYLFYRLHGEKFRSLSLNSLILSEKYQFLKNVVFNKQEFQLNKKDEYLVQGDLWDATLLPLTGEQLADSQ